MPAAKYNGADVERLAEGLYRAWCAFIAEKNPRQGTVKWFALRHDLKALWRLHAQLVLQAYALYDGGDDGRDVTVPAAVGQE